MHPDIDEALRYLGVRADADGSLHRQMDALADELARSCPPRWVWTAVPLAFEGGEPLTGGLRLPGRTAARMLGDCCQAVLLCCTLGASFDAWIRREQARDMARAAMLDALGSAFVERGCNAAEEEIRARFPALHLTDRFSPGYGDLPLTLQGQLLAATNAARRLGVTCTDTCLLLPQKTVTAVIGLAEEPQAARVRGCAFCSMNKTCPLRKTGRFCQDD